MAWIVWTALSVIVLLISLSLIKKKNQRLPPGPKGLPILGHLHLLGKNPHQDLHRLARKHGPIMGMRFGFVPTVVVSSPAAAELILKTHDLVFASRRPQEIWRRIGYNQKNFIFGRYGPYWRNMRKLVTLELLSSFKISQFQPMRRAELELFVSSLKLDSEKQETVDLSARVSGLIGDVICLMVYGRKYGSGYFDEKGIKAVISETMEMAGRPNLADYFPYIGALNLQGLNGRMKELGKIFDDFVEKIIDDHKQERKQEKTEDFVDTIMAIMESGEAGFEFDRGHVKAVLLELFIAGMDTSAATVEWTLSELIRHPLVMKKLQEELESVVGINHMVEESHLDMLKYLDSVVKETLRLHPVAPLLIPHESVKDCMVDGFYIPEKSQAIVNVWAIGRDPAVWSNPETFSPERFLASSIDLRGHDFQLIPFGSGRRSCPGLQLGLTIAKIVVAQLTHCFDWKLPNAMLNKDLDMSEHFGVVTTRAKHLMATPSWRLHK